MTTIIKIIHKIIYGICFIGMLVLLLMMLLTTADVAGRSLFNHPIAGTYEVTGYMLATIILLGLGYSQQINQHVRVDMFTSKMSLMAQFILNILFTLCATVFFAFVSWQGTVESLNAMRVKSASDILHIPAYPFQFLVAFGAFLFVVELIIKLGITIVRFKRGTYEKESTGNALALD